MLQCLQAFFACRIWTLSIQFNSSLLQLHPTKPIMASSSSSSSSSSYSFFTNHHHHNIIINLLINNINISNPFSSSSSSSSSSSTLPFIIPPPPHPSSRSSRSPSSLSVCWCWRCWCWWSSPISIPSSIPSSSLFFVSTTILSSLLSFSAASDTIPTSRTSTHSPPPSSSSSSPIYFSFSPNRLKSPIHTNNHNKKDDDTHFIILLTTLISVALFLIITCLSLMACFNFIKRRRSSSKRVEAAADSDNNHHDDQESGFIINKTQFPDRPISSLDDDMKKFDNPCFSSANKRFSWDEIQRLTMNFTSRVIGEGGFSTVYLSRFSDSSLGALKIHTNSERLNRIFKQELDVLLQVRHPNIVKFLGYCDEKEEGALVFEYVSNGNLHEKLHEINGGDLGGVGGGGGVLPWKRRMSIAFQLAQAIEYLHDKSTHQIIHGDIKSSNVLLDDEFNCKLCDFGFSKMGFSSTVMPSSMSPLMGSPGYMDPNYLRTGIASKKNDVYSFGVIVLELITGIEAFCSEKEKLLTSIAAPVLKDSNRVAEMVDPRLGNEFDLEEAMSMASISALCLKQQPGMRPSMAEILRMMTEKISSSLSTSETQRINTPPSPSTLMMKER